MICRRCLPQSDLPWTMRVGDVGVARTICAARDAINASCTVISAPQPQRTRKGVNVRPLSTAMRRRAMILSRTAAISLVIVVFAVFAPLPSSAQTSLATLRGKVTDQQGGVLPGAAVTTRQVDTNTTRTGVTNETGQFYVPSLPAGAYEVVIELQGFSTAKRTLTLRVGQEASADFALTIGAVSETVQVTGAAALVETKSTLGGVIDKREIDNLPTIDRNFAGLAQLTPGVSSTGGGSMGFGAGGQRQYQNQIFMDGATNAQQFYGTQAE